MKLFMFQAALGIAAF